MNPLLVPTPMEVVTDTLPLAPLPTVAVIVLESTTVNEAAAVPPKRTAVAPVKKLPLMSTAVPLAPEVGEKLLTTGVLSVVKDTWLPYAVPAELVA